MGLQGIELIMDFEEAFGVELTDAEAIESVTPRMIGDVIFSKLKATDERICQSQRAFYILRRAFIRIFNIDRKSITPDTQFRDFIGRSQEKEIWEQLRLAVAARSWPKLTLPLTASRNPSTPKTHAL
jgi:acyl carrier protein